MKRLPWVLTFLCSMFIAGYAMAGPAFWWSGGGGGSGVSPSGTAAANQVTYWTSPTAISGNTLMTYTPGTGVLALNTNGSVATPTMTMGTVADPDTGIYHPAANTMGMVGGGAEMMRFGPNCLGTGIDGACMTSGVGNFGIEIINTAGIARVDLGRPDNATQYMAIFDSAGAGSITMQGPASTNLTIGTSVAGTSLFVNTANTLAFTVTGTQGLTVPGDFVWTPVTDGQWSIGSGSNRLKLLRAVTITMGDTGFDDKECVLCHHKFEVDDDIVMHVHKRVDGDDPHVLTVPVHLWCRLMTAMKHMIGVQ